MTKISLIKSVYYALKGIFNGILLERNIKLLILFGITILLSALLLDISLIYFLILFFICSFMIMLEVLNHFFERLLDLFYPTYNKEVGELKDYLAGMVLLMVIIVLITSLIIFYNPILTLLKFLFQNKLLSLFLILNFILLIIIDFFILKKRNLKEKY